MKRDRFIRQRTAEWKRLEELVDTARNKSAKGLNGRQITELSRIYRAVCYDLSLVKSREWGTQLENYLNGLVARGHNCLYRNPPRAWKAIVEYLTAGLPRVLRKRKWFFYTALALFAIPFIAGMIVAMVDPVLAESVIPKESLVSASDMYAEDLYETIDEQYVGERSMMTGFYVINNIGIAFKMFALGIFLGIGTVQQLVFNGIVLGMISGFVTSQGHGNAFFSFVISHGAFELTGLVIAGAAGLMLGYGVIHPGKRTRIDSMRELGLDAVKLVLGAGIMLGIAALIEAYFSPMAIPSAIKYAVGTVMWILVAAYFVLGGRKGESAAREEDLDGGHA